MASKITETSITKIPNFRSSLTLSKKAVISISVRLIIIIIIAVLFLILFIAFFRYSFEKSSVKIETELRRYALPPVAVISSPNPEGVYTVFQPIDFDGSGSYDPNYRITGYFWDFDGDSIIDSSGNAVKHSYWEPGEYNVSLKVVNDEGAIGAASQIVKVYTRNEKKKSLGNSLFMIRDNERANEETILRLLPIIMWNDGKGFHNIPYYVYYVPQAGTTLSQTELREIMEKYKRKEAYIFDDREMDSLCSHKCTYNWGGEEYIIHTFTPENFEQAYFDFWGFYEYVVLVNKKEESSKLIASLFAAFYNSPIIFIDSSNLKDYKEYISNYKGGPTQRVYYVPSIQSMDSEVDEWVSSSWDRQSYTLEELRNPQGVNRLIRLTSNVTMEQD